MPTPPPAPGHSSTPKLLVVLHLTPLISTSDFHNPNIHRIPNLYLTSVHVTPNLTLITMILTSHP